MAGNKNKPCRADAMMTAGTVRPKVRVEVVRDGAVTRYSVFFPWDQLGAPDETPTPATVIGFSLAVNDVDPARGAPRHGLTLFGGIVDDKEPKRFGPAWIRPPLSPAPFHPTLTSP